MKKRILSLFLALAMISAIIPVIVVSTTAADLTPHSIELACLTGDHVINTQSDDGQDGGKDGYGWIPYHGTPTTIVGDGKYTLSITMPGNLHFVKLGIVSAGAPYSDRDPGPGTPLPADYNTTGSVIFNKVTISGTDCTPAAGNNISDFVGYSAPGVTTGFMEANLWNSFFTEHNRLTGGQNSTIMAFDKWVDDQSDQINWGYSAFVPDTANPGPAFRLAGGSAPAAYDKVIKSKKDGFTPITTITVEFTITGTGGGDEDVDTGRVITTAAPSSTVPVQLMARNSITWNNTNPYKSEIVQVGETGEYTFKLSIPASEAIPDLPSLALRSPGTDFAGTAKEEGEAAWGPGDIDCGEKPNAPWQERAECDIISVTINGKPIETIDMRGTYNNFLVNEYWNVGFVSYNIWNAWATDGQLLIGVDKVPTPGDENGAMNFAVPGVSAITDIEVKIIMNQDTDGGDNTGPITQAPVTTDPNTSDGNDTTTDPDTTTGFKKGDANGDGVINIADAVEILKFVAGLENLIEKDEKCKAAASIVNDSPLISDAVEVLKFVAGLASIIEG